MGSNMFKGVLLMARSVTCASSSPSTIEGQSPPFIHNHPLPHSTSLLRLSDRDSSLCLEASTGSHSCVGLYTHIHIQIHTYIHITTSSTCILPSIRTYTFKHI